jgi:hypothetical protein
VNGSASETGPSRLDGFSSRQTRNQPIREAIKGLFKSAAKALARPDDEPKPEPRRKRGGDTDKAFGLAWRAVLRRAVTKSRAVAQSRAANAAHDRTAGAYVRATMYLADTLDWLNLWQDNAVDEHGPDDDFSAKQDRHFPQP